MIYRTHSHELTQFMAFETIKTDASKVPTWPKWAKAVYDGWSLDAGFNYDDTKVLKDGALAIGRKFGTLADYLPLDFPLLNKITITLYPASWTFEDLFNHPSKPKFGYGIGYIKAELKFG
jgi:hypothetical protein